MHLKFQHEYCTYLFSFISFIKTKFKKLKITNFLTSALPPQFIFLFIFAANFPFVQRYMYSSIYFVFALVSDKLFFHSTFFVISKTHTFLKRQTTYKRFQYFGFLFCKIYISKTRIKWHHQMEKLCCFGFYQKQEIVFDVVYYRNYWVWRRS